MQKVIQVFADEFNQMKKIYITNTTLPAGAAFRMKGKRVTVTGYTKSKKVMFQGSAAEQEAQRWANDSENKLPKQEKTSTRRNDGLPAGFEHWSVLGSDEVGTGSYFGPLTVASVYVRADQVEAITNLGVRDSKKLTDPEIIKLAKKVMADCPYHIVNLNPPLYNEKIQDRSQAALKALCHNLALSQVLTKIKPAVPDAILIDEFEQPRTYFKHLRGQDPVIKKNVYFRTKGEQAHAAVAAASVVARYYSLQMMDQLSEEAGMTLPIGAGHVVDEVAARLIRHHQDLGKFAKLHFTNTAKAQQLARSNR
ncbi:MAG TPA: ribonuclease HIII [Candidatus Limosilactobacillus merdipullorum]|uniref:Ribonuclease HIII n=1 Tax=Candidatus Limosilactobacillus merdipullorum TaxID=2838653 RepID=A0A9D1QNG6_9LACO|nr:ribonuclease HIII [Candidatus Limosilactobacillus merdipullorum]